MLRTIICRHAQKHHFPNITFKTHRAAPKCISFQHHFIFGRAIYYRGKSRNANVVARPDAVHLPPASFLLLYPPYFKEVKTPTRIIIIAKKPCFVEDEIHHGKN